MHLNMHEKFKILRQNSVQGFYKLVGHIKISCKFGFRQILSRKIYWDKEEQFDVVVNNSNFSI